MGIFDESEKGRTKASQTLSRAPTARRSWPLSARLLVGTMFVLNILLAAFLVKTEMKRPGAPARSTPLPLRHPDSGSTPQRNAPPAQGSSREAESSRPLKTSPVETRAAALPSTRMAKHRRITALRAGKTPRAVLSASMPRTVIPPPVEPLGPTPAPVRNPAASSTAGANVAPAGRPASFGNPGVGVPSNAGPHPNAPPASAPTPSAINRGVTAKGTRLNAETKVASVGLPAMQRGSVAPKMPVAPISHKIEFVPRPPVKLENCGDDKAFIACPTLKNRYDVPYAAEVP